MVLNEDGLGGVPTSLVLDIVMTEKGAETYKRSIKVVLPATESLRSPIIGTHADRTAQGTLQKSVSPINPTQDGYHKHRQDHQ